MATNQGQVKIAIPVISCEVQATQEDSSIQLWQENPSISSWVTSMLCLMTQCREGSPSFWIPSLHLLCLWRCHCSLSPGLPRAVFSWPSFCLVKRHCSYLAGKKFWRKLCWMCFSICLLRVAPQSWNVKWLISLAQLLQLDWSPEALTFLSLLEDTGLQ